MALPVVGKLKLIVTVQLVVDDATVVQVTGGEIAPLFPSIKPKEKFPLGSVVDLTMALQSTDCPRI